MQQYILDRIEGNFVIFEENDGKTINVHKEKIKGNLKEGYVFTKDGEYFMLNEVLTKARKDKIDRLIKDIWQ